MGLIILTLLGLKYLPGWVKLVWLFQSRIKPEEMQLIRTVSGMANNLNQIAYRLNAFGISALNEELNVLKQLIHELMRRLKP